VELVEGVGSSRAVGSMDQGPRHALPGPHLTPSLPPFSTEIQFGLGPLLIKKKEKKHKKRKKYKKQNKKIM
jgi:hypothetical protein